MYYLAVCTENAFRNGASLLSRATSGLQFNEQMEHEDGPLVFGARVQDGARRHRIEAAQLGLSVGAIA
jgi:hypothetical protein